MSLIFKGLLYAIILSFTIMVLLCLIACILMLLVAIYDGVRDWIKNNRNYNKN